MMNLKKTATVSMAIALASGTVWADTFGVGPNQFDIDFVNIGNSGNDWDVYVPNTTPDHPYETAGHGFGQVNYEYRIGQFEVTADQFAKARAADSSIGDGDEGSIGSDAPATRVSYNEAAKFVNWLTSGSASSGAYIINGFGSVIGIDRSAAISTYGTVYVLPNEDEWHKAAYFDASGTNGYSLYANGTSTLPASGTDANYNGANSSPWVVGSGAVEQNGTYDMNGNVYEWTESPLVGGSDTNNPKILRGGYYFSTPSRLAADNRSQSSIQGTENNGYGFRVAAIPEPGTISLMSLSTVSLFLARTMRRRKRLGSSLLPVRRENACDIFEEQNVYVEELQEDTCISVLYDSVTDKVSSCWSTVVDFYSDIDKKFWDRMVARYEIRKAKRTAFKATFKKRALDSFDTFLAKIMK